MASKLATSATASITGSTSAGATFTVAREKAPRWFPDKMSNREAADFWRQHIEYARKAKLGKWIPNSVRECLEPVILIMVANFCSPKFPLAVTVEEVTDGQVYKFLQKSTEPTSSVKNGWKGRLAKVVRNAFKYQDGLHHYICYYRAAARMMEEQTLLNLDLDGNTAQGLRYLDGRAFWRASNTAQGFGNDAGRRTSSRSTGICENGC
jgi:hypothetical protein